MRNLMEILNDLVYFYFLLNDKKNEQNSYKDLSLVIAGDAGTRKFTLMRS